MTKPIKVHLINETPPRDGRLPCPPDKHRWRLAYTRGRDTLGERCSRCGAGRDREATPAERKLIRTTVGLWGSDKREHNVHWLWHKFVRVMQDQDQDQNDKWKWTPETAYDVILKAERFTKKHEADGIHMVGCDDSYFSGSDLVLVHHKSPRKWMGVTVVVLAQCSGQPPAQFFLYPGHVDGLIEALQEAKREHRRLAPLELADDRQERTAWQSLLRSQKLCLLPIRRTRTALHVESYNPKSGIVQAVIPAWRPPWKGKRTFPLHAEEFSPEVRKALKPGLRLHVQAALRAKNVGDLALTGWEMPPR